MNKMMNMNKQYIIVDGKINSNYVRVIAFEEWSWDYEKDEAVLVNKTYKLQIKIYGFLLSKYHTIKEWKFDINNKADDEASRIDAIELFNNLIKPYKCYGNF